jgi:GalNAc-alpha-(1->4)-GalNAc-alpha-(1->3)-diNAcBac-PP-undecaprenol alpha-1,4-N-acetyl-D-galactosaminyltransferase
MRKIAFVIYSMGSGGAERVISLLSKWFSSRYQVGVINFSSEAPFYEFDEKVKSITLNCGTIGGTLSLLNNINRLTKLQRTLRNEKPDVVISFITPTNILSILACKLANIPLIVSERSNILFPCHVFWRIMRRLLYGQARKVVVLSQFDVQKYGYLKNTCVIHNPISVQERKFADRNKIILGVGRIDYLKGFDQLVTAYKSVRKQGWKVIIVGDGPLKDDLKKQIATHHLENDITVIDRQKNIFDYYYSALIFALTSRIEGFPNVLCEAMACGCACIAFDCPTGPRELIRDGENGFLVKMEDIPAYSGRLRQLMENDELRTMFSSNGVAIKTSFSIDHIGNKWESEILEAIK